MTNIELVCVNNMKDIATKNFECMMAYKVDIDDITLVSDFALLQAKSHMLITNKQMANLQETTTYNLPGCKLVVFRFMVAKKEKMYVATIYKSENNNCYPNAKVAAKK